MHKRFFLLLAVVLLVGAFTRAFAQNASAPTITRAGAVALLVEGDPVLKARFGSIKEKMPPLPLFKDVSAEHWYAPYIETAFEAGIVLGNGAALFRPGDMVTEEEAVAFVARSQARRNASVAQSLQTPSSGHWFDVPLRAAVQGGLQVPNPVRLGQPMQRDAYHVLLSSAGIPDSRSLTVQSPPPVIPPTPVVVAAAPVARAPTTPIVRQPAVTTAPAPVRYTPPSVVPVARAQSVVTPTAPTASVSRKNFAISMPSLGISDLTVTHPADPLSKDGLLAPLKYGVGHLFSYPGKGGKILIYGHSSSYPWDVSSYTKIFRQINKLSVGDTISVTYAGKSYTYRVTHKQTVPASDMSVYQRGGGEELILYTCWPPDSIKERYLVHASPV